MRVWACQLFEFCLHDYPADDKGKVIECENVESVNYKEYNHGGLEGHGRVVLDIVNYDWCIRDIVCITHRPVGMTLSILIPKVSVHVLKHELQNSMRKQSDGCRIQNPYLLFLREYSNSCNHC